MLSLLIFLHSLQLAVYYFVVIVLQIIVLLQSNTFVCHFHPLNSNSVSLFSIALRFWACPLLNWCVNQLTCYMLKSVMPLKSKVFFGAILQLAFFGLMSFYVFFCVVSFENVPQIFDNECSI